MKTTKTTTRTYNKKNDASRILLKQRLHNLCVTQKDIAERLHMTRPYLCRILAGERDIFDIPFWQAAKLAELLGWTLEELKDKCELRRKEYIEIVYSDDKDDL